MKPQETQSKLDRPAQPSEQRARSAEVTNSTVESRQPANHQGPERHGQAPAAVEPATEKQIAYLDKLGVQVPAGLTKFEASRLIDQALGREHQDAGRTRMWRES